MRFRHSQASVLAAFTPAPSLTIERVSFSLFRVFRRTKAERQLTQAMHDVHVWAKLDGVEFERAVARIYRERGFEVEFTPRSNDQGIDLILKKDGVVSIVQCKTLRKQRRGQRNQRTRRRTCIVAAR